MKLTNKDKEFVEELRKLLEKHDLEVVLKTDGRSRMVLRGHYGDKLGDRLRLTRQGVYWRFDHILNHAYVEAYESIYWLESTFGTSLRQHALAIARERIALRKKALENGFQNADQLVSRRQTIPQPPESPPSELSGESPDTSKASNSRRDAALAGKVGGESGLMHRNRPD